MRFPNSVDELIAELDRKFPEFIPDADDSERKIFHAAGQRSVVNFLKQWRASASHTPPAPRQRGQGRDVSRK
jgi:hypothetical protein